MSRRPMAMFAAAVVLVVVAGCGGGDSSDDESLTKAEFVEQGSAICAKRVKQIGADIRAGGTNKGGPQETNGPTQGDPVADALLSNFQAEVDELRALGAPSGDEKTIEAMLHAMERGVKEAEANGSKEEALFSAGNQLGKGREMAEKYGLEGCASLL